ncbi:right-handed parallel beta-helix repeat-containing protein [Poriferisphaera sp. WC338]|uniref:right-handed parallel beta-helix repeat-containing protein n=1 Tax=Poriferisphaera sp. WC338 TaxID=3425129 RepID=UPI003D819C96
MNDTMTNSDVSNENIQDRKIDHAQHHIESSPSAPAASRRHFVGAMVAAAGLGALVNTPQIAKAATSSSSSPYIIYLADYSPVGDGIADDTTPVKNALLAAEGKLLVFEEGKTYKVTQALTVSKNTTIFGMESALKFVVSGYTENLVLRSHVTISNLTVENAGSSPVGAGNFQCPILIGKYGPGTGYSGITLRDITIKSNRPNGNGILITGDSHDILIDGVTMRSATSLGRGIAIHWGGADVHTNGTTHPYNIRITNVVASDFTYSGADTGVIFLSGCYNIEVSNVDANNVYKGLVGYAGDRGDQYAATIQSGRSGQGIIFKNIVMRSVIYQGVKINGKPILSGNSQPWPVRMESCMFIGKSGSGNGIILANCSAPVFDGCKVSYFDGQGIASHEKANGVRFLGGEVDHNGGNGFYCSHSTNPPANWYISNVYLHDNNTNNNTIDSQSSGIFLGNSIRPIIHGCRIGDPGGETQRYGIRISPSCVSPKLEDNDVQGVYSGGVAYSIGASSNYDINAHGQNNTAASGITGYEGAPIYVIDGNGNRVFKASSWPFSGSWVKGDRVYNSNPYSSGPVGWVCTSAPNSWNSFG